MTVVLHFTPCPECRISDSPPLRELWPPRAGGVATTAEGDGLVVAAAPAGGLPSTPAGAARLPATPVAGSGEVTPSTRTPRSGAAFTGIARACAAWLWTRRGVLFALAAVLVLLGSCTDSDWGW